MIVFLTMDPYVFGIQGVVDGESRAGAESLLNAMLENAVVISSENDFLEKVSISAAELERTSSRLGQQILILAAELLKAPKRAVTDVRQRRSSGSNSACTTLAEIAAKEPVDLIVCRSTREAEEIRSCIQIPSVDVCVIGDYPRSTIERRRRHWCSSQALHSLSDSSALDLIQRALCYRGILTVADKMIGRAAKNGRLNNQLLEFARGVVYLAEASLHGSPAGSHRDVRVVTVAGASGAAVGFIDPVIAEKFIRKAISEEDKAGVISSLNIVLKSDRDPPVFRDRLVAIGGRCWGVRHGVDDIGKLRSRKNRRSPTFLDPDSQANRSLLSDILALRDVPLQSP